MIGDVGFIWFADEDHEGVDILNDDDKVFKDTGKWLDLTKVDIVKQDDTVPQLACEVDEHCPALLLNTAFQRDGFALETVNLDILDRKEHWNKDTNELNILFWIFKEQLNDSEYGNERLVWNDSDLKEDVEEDVT